jgi:DNA-binding CsgD family transcriptional regulator
MALHTHPYSSFLTPLVQLSPREQEIVRMVAEGHPNKVIAAVLNISTWTVGTHLRRIFAKFGVGSRAAMVARYLEIRKAAAPLQSNPANRRSAASLAANGTLAGGDYPQVRQNRNPPETQAGLQVSQTAGWGQLKK